MTILEFENLWKEKIKTELLKNFPSDFITNINCENLNMPGKSLVKGPELFGNFEIIDTAGETFTQTDNIYKLKYILYSNRNTPEKIEVPVDEDELKSIVKLYEEHIDELIKTVEKNYRQTFQSTKEFHTTSNKIFTSLNLSRY